MATLCAPMHATVPTQVNMNPNLDDWVSFTVMDIALSPDGAYLLAATDKNRCLVHVHPPLASRPRPPRADLRTAALSTAASAVRCAAALGRYKVGDSDQLRGFYGLDNDGYANPRCAWHPSGLYVYCTSQDNTVSAPACPHADAHFTRAHLRGCNTAKRDLAVGSQTVKDAAFILLVSCCVSAWRALSRRERADQCAAAASAPRGLPRLRQPCLGQNGVWHVPREAELLKSQATARVALRDSAVSCRVLGLRNQSRMSATPIVR